MRLTAAVLRDPATNPTKLTVRLAETDTAGATFPGAIGRDIGFEFPSNNARFIRVRGFDVASGETVTFADADEEWTVAYDLQGNRMAALDVRQREPGVALRNVLTLDTVYDRVTPGSFVVVERAAIKTDFKLDNPLVARVEAVTTVTPTDYGLAGVKATRLTLDRPWLDATDAALADIRGVTVYLQSEPLELAGEPFDADVGPVFQDDPAATAVELDEVYDGLPAGRQLAVAGERTDTPGTSGVKAAEPVTLDRAEQVVDEAGTRGQGRPHTRLVLRGTGLAHSYQRGTVTVFGNVVKADHGETKAEVLGSGRAATPNQRFTLKQSPLTYLPAATPAGAEDTLRVRVNGVLWHRADRPAELTPADREYVLRTDTDGKAVVVFGDGTHGARLPTGSENVRATYRVGLGRAGNVDPDTVTQLVTRPLGVKGVTNPPAAGGARTRSRSARPGETRRSGSGHSAGSSRSPTTRTSPAGSPASPRPPPHSCPTAPGRSSP